MSSHWKRLSLEKSIEIAHGLEQGEQLRPEETDILWNENGREGVSHSDLCLRKPFNSGDCLCGNPDLKQLFLKEK